MKKLKRKIEKRTTVPSENLLITFNSKQLDDEKIVQYYSIRDDSIVKMTLLDKIDDSSLFEYNLHEHFAIIDSDLLLF